MTVTNLSLNKPFEKPVVILASPRSGSTLLFETLSQCKDLWSIGGESHAVFESIDELQVGADRDSNRLDASSATDSVKNRVIGNFCHHLEDRNGNVLNPGSGISGIRLLEKTPKNSLRIPFINAIFPDALYIYLFRDPRENISSIMEAWKSDRWITYPALPNWDGHWSLLLPPGWQSMKGKTLEEIAAFQWQQSNQYILDDLAHMPENRYTTLSYKQLVDDPVNTIKQLCSFIGLEFDPHLQNYTSGALPLSRFTQTPPDSDKWKKNEREINRILPKLKKTIRNIEKFSANTSNTDNAALHDDWQNTRIPRNAPCPCGSGKKYKRCHGQQK